MQRFIRRTAAVLAVFVGATAIMASAANADRPLVFDEGEFDDTFVVPGGVGVCDFPVQFRNTGSFKTTVYFDSDGETRAVKSHVNGTSYYSLPGGDVVVVDRWVVNTFLELPPGSDENTPPLSRTDVGNAWNAHAGGGGVLVNDSGRIEFDANFEVVSISGPHESFFGEFDDFCAALAASAGG